MSRVNWKGPYVTNSLLEKIKGYQKDIKTTSKDSTILPKFIGFTLKIYNGKTFTIIKIVDEMVGHKLGEFVSTRKQFSYKKKKK